nr:TonB-dependent receptor [Pseudomaricurvus alkylphenolicus]
MANDSEDNFLLEEIIVTARFKEESAQDIGQSISAFGGDAMERAGMIDFEDIARRTPGLDFSDRGPNRNEMSIRGISKLVSGSTLDILGTQTLITQFVDDIPVSSPNSSQRDFNLFDFNRVEVLKGPQPTYFGEGSVGGTVRYFSADPSLQEGIGGKFSADVSSVDGGGNNHTVNGVLDLTIIPDVLGIKLTGFQRDDEGFIDNALTGSDDVNSYKSEGGRLVVLAQPSEELSIRFAAHFADDEIGGDWLVDDTGDDYTISALPTDSFGTDEYELYSLNVSYDFGKFSVTSVTGLYQRERQNLGYDFAQSESSLPALYGINGTVVTENFTEEDNFTQEIRILTNFDGPLNFTGGLFYKDAEYSQTAVARSQEIAAISLTGDDLFFGSEKASPANREQKAVFLEANYEINDKLTMIAGARWLDEEQVSPVADPKLLGDPAIALCVADALGNFPAAPVFGINPCVATMVLDGGTYFGFFGLADIKEVTNEVDGEILPKFAVEYQLDEDILAYASATKGIRNGGLNSSFVVAQAPEVSTDQIGYGQDEVWAYELGIKSVLLGGDLVLNGSVYVNDYSDIQTLVSTSAGALFQNAGDATTHGFEVDALYRVNDWLTLSGAANYTVAEFDDAQNWETPDAAFIRELLGRPENIVAEGNELPNVPKYAYSLAADVYYPLADRDMALVAHLGYQYTDNRFMEAINDRDAELDGYGLANLRVGLQAGQWAVTAYVSNLTNEIAEQSNLMVGVGGTTNLSYINRPRTVGINLRYEL